MASRFAQRSGYVEGARFNMKPRRRILRIRRNLGIQTSSSSTRYRPNDFSIELLAEGLPPEDRDIMSIISLYRSSPSPSPLYLFPINPINTDSPTPAESRPHPRPAHL